jgi:hypothetical protein
VVVRKKILRTSNFFWLESDRFKNRLLLTSAEREKPDGSCSAGVHPIYVLPQKDRNRRKHIGNARMTPTVCNPDHGLPSPDRRRASKVSLKIHPARRPWFTLVPAVVRHYAALCSWGDGSLNKRGGRFSDHHGRGCGVLARDREAVYIEELQTGCDVVKWIWRVANLAERKSPSGAWIASLHGVRGGTKKAWVPR